MDWKAAAALGAPTRLWMALVHIPGAQLPSIVSLNFRRYSPERCD